MSHYGARRTRAALGTVKAWRCLDICNNFDQTTFLDSVCITVAISCLSHANMQEKYMSHEHQNGFCNAFQMYGMYGLYDLYDLKLTV